MSQPTSTGPVAQAAAPPGTTTAVRPTPTAHQAFPATQPSQGPAWNVRLAGVVRAGLAGTPGRLRVLLGLTVVITVAFGVVAAQAFRQTDGALSRADANTEQLVRVQAIHTNLVRANATATNAFLVGGLEPADQRTEYTEALAEASRLIAEAARHQPADAAALGALNMTVLNYAGLIEQARANNRQGLPVGAQYLREATGLLRTDALPVLNALVTANSERVEEEFDRVGNGGGWLRWFGLLTILVLAGALVWLARRTHRYVNLPIVAAGVVVLLTTLVGAAGMAGVDGRAKDIRSGDYAATRGLAEARIAAYDARSNESLTLIARGSGATFEQAWKDSSTIVTDRLARVSPLIDRSTSLPNGWTIYITAHQAVRSADDNGRWEDAVRLSISGPARTAFDEFDDASGRILAETGAQTRSELQRSGGWLGAAGWLGIPIGVLAALLCWLGLSQRLEEYR